MFWFGLLLGVVIGILGTLVFAAWWLEQEVPHGG